MALQFKLGAVYSFDLWAPAILGSSHRNVTINGVMKETGAMRAGCRTREIHAQVFNSLPVGTPNNAGAYDYVEFQTTTGETVIIGQAWIKEESVVEITSQNYLVTVGNISAADLPRLRNALVTSGFTKIEIELSDR